MASNQIQMFGFLNMQMFKFQKTNLLSNTDMTEISNFSHTHVANNRVDWSNQFNTYRAPKTSANQSQSEGALVSISAGSLIQFKAQP